MNLQDKADKADEKVRAGCDGLLKTETMRGITSLEYAKALERLARAVRRSVKLHNEAYGR